MVCGSYLAAAIVVAVPFVIQVVCGVMCGVRDIPCSCYRCSSTICHSSCVRSDVWCAGHTLQLLSL